MAFCSSVIAPMPLITVLHDCCCITRNLIPSARLWCHRIFTREREHNYGYTVLMSQLTWNKQRLIVPFVEFDWHGILC